jgi:hypothetical protein
VSTAPSGRLEAAVGGGNAACADDRDPHRGGSWPSIPSACDHTRGADGHAPEDGPLNGRSNDTPYRRLGRAIGPLVARRYPRRVGLFELSALGSLEWMRRHLAIINELQAFRRSIDSGPLEVLDFGGADGSLARALRLYGIAHLYKITVADIEAPPAPPDDAPSEGTFLLLDPEGDLPLPDRSVDIVVSSDVFEHIPPELRAGWAAELHRVARHGQVHSVPADDPDGSWASTETDVAFQSWYRGLTGGDERWTSEHLANGVPTIAELQSLFPSATIKGIVNCNVWLHSMHAKYGRKDFAHRVAFVTDYLRRYRRLEDRPPHKNALLVVRQA